MRRIVAVGAGLAGLRTAEALRATGFDGDLTVVGQEHHPPYDRPPLSKQVLTGDLAPDACRFPVEHLEATWRLGTAAVALDPLQRRIRLSDGDRLSYDGLVVASGCRAAAWPKPVPLSGIRTLRTLDDSLALQRDADEHTRVAIVGAGFLGCEVAAALRTRGVRTVTLIDAAPYPLAPLGAAVGTRIAGLHREHGVRLHLGTTVQHFVGSGRVEELRLADGTSVGADLVLLALGAAPNTEWLAGSGIRMHQGRVLCDAQCRAVGTDRVVAAGDAGIWPDPWTGGLLRLEHWSNAAETARVAAATLHEPEQGGVYAPVPTFWTDQYDLKLKSVGRFADATSHTVVEEDPAGKRLVVEAHRSGELIGAVTVNRPRRHIEYQRTFAAKLMDPQRPVAADRLVGGSTCA